MHKRVFGVAICLMAMTAFSVVPTSGAATDIVVPKSSAATKATTVTLEFAGPTETQANWQPILANFARAYPNIKINTSFVPSGAHSAALLTKIRAGNAPDIIHTYGGYFDPTSLYKLASENRLLDLTGSPWQKRVPAAVIKESSFKGKVYGSAIALVIGAVVYDLDQLKQLGFQRPPQTWPQLLSLCSRARAAGKSAYASVWGSVGTPQSWAQVVVPDLYARDPFWTSKRNNHKVTFATSTSWRGLLDSVVEQKNAGCYQPNPQGTTQNPAAAAMVAEGKAVAFFRTCNGIGQISAIKPGMNLVCEAFPPPDGSLTRRVGFLVSPMLVGTRTTSSPGAVRTFINFAARPAQSRLYAKLAGAVTPYDLAHNIIPAAFSPRLTTLLRSKQVGSYPAIFWPSPRIVPTALNPVMVGLFTGQLTVSDILAGLDRAWEAALRGDG